MLRNCLARQINEVESLHAMFCGPNEMTLWNEFEYESLKQLINGKVNNKSDEVPQVAFQLQLPLEKPYPDLVIQIKFSSFYPSSDSAQVLRDASSEFVVSKLGQECILDLVEFAKDWIYANVPVPSKSNSSTTTATSSAPAPAKPKAAQQGKNAKVPAKPKPDMPVKEQEFRRILIWFSTIAPDRSKTVAEWAKQLGLTGISRLGSPALVLVEGQKEDVDEYVSSLRSFRWKKMDIVWEDKCKTTNINSCRRFNSFQECMVALPELQIVGLDEMFKEGLKIRG